MTISNSPFTVSGTPIFNSGAPAIFAHVTNTSNPTPTVTGVGASVARNSVGNYTVTFSSALPNANYTVVTGQDVGASTNVSYAINIYNQTTTGFMVSTVNAAGVLIDFVSFSFACHSVGASGSNTSSTKAWVKFDGTGAVGLQTILGSYNCATVNKTATGKYTITFGNPMADANYAVSGSGYSASNTAWSIQVDDSGSVGWTTSAVKIIAAGVSFYDGVYTVIIAGN